MVGSPGGSASRARPEIANVTAGTYAHRCGRVVSLVLSRASIAHPAPNAARTAPTIVASEASGRTPNVRAAAARAPVPKEVAMMRASGPVGAAEAGGLAEVVVRVEVVITVPFRTAVVGLSMRTTVVVMRPARPGHLAGFGLDTDPSGRILSCRRLYLREGRLRA